MNNTLDIKIVPASPLDAKGMMEVFYESWKDTYPNEEFGITVDDIEDRYKNAFTEESLKKKAEQLAHLGKGETLLLMKDGTKVVGVCRVVEHSHKNQLQAIYLLSVYQGKGLGRRFWEEVQKIFNPRKNIYVEVATYNAKAIAFYKKLGFADTGRRFSDEKFRMKSGAMIPEMEMILKTTD